MGNGKAQWKVTNFLAQLLAKQAAGLAVDFFSSSQVVSKWEMSSWGPEEQQWGCAVGQPPARGMLWGDPRLCPADGMFSLPCSW